MGLAFWTEGSTTSLVWVTVGNGACGAIDVFTTGRTIFSLIDYEYNGILYADPATITRNHAVGSPRRATVAP